MDALSTDASGQEPRSTSSIVSFPDYAAIINEALEDAEFQSRFAEHAETDIGNGERFLQAFGDMFRVLDGKTWFAFYDGIWRRELAGEAAFEAAKAAVSAMQTFARRRGFRGAEWASSSASLPRLKAMLRCAASRLSTRMSAFNKRHNLLAVQNGVIEFRNDVTLGYHVVHREAHADDLITQQADCVYDAEAQAPLWRQHLERILPNAATREYVQCLFGYVLLGGASRQEIYFFHGKGGDGKSTTVDVIREVLGGYAVSLDSKLLIQSGGRRGADDASPTLVSLGEGVRLASASEPQRSQPLDEAMTKKLASTTSFKARRPYGDLQDIEINFKVIVECNQLPRYRFDDGMARRLIVVPFKVQIPHDERDYDLKDKLLEERSGILNWMIEGALMNKRSVMPMPKEVEEATLAYQRLDLSVEQWVDARVVFGGSFIGDWRDFLEDYEAYCKGHGLHPRSKADVRKVLHARGASNGGKDNKTRRVRIRGCRLSSSASGEAGRSL